jgi:NTP pyrophosphatase (non-canonical NTP hydrolase)
MSIDLPTLQQRVQSVLGNVAHPRVGAALALSEETGEVCDLVLKRECYGKAVTAEALGGELADVLVCVAELANAYEIDLAAACEAKLTDLAERVPNWETEFGPHLAAARERMDG